jgi:WD40 repeat protein
MQTTDESLLWLSESDHLRSEQRRAKAAQASQAGEPIDLPSKPLDIIVRGDDVWVAENGFVARRVDLVVRACVPVLALLDAFAQTGKTRASFRGHKGPVACLALHRLPDGRLLLFTGSWDKSIRIWDAKVHAHSYSYGMRLHKRYAQTGQLLHALDDAHTDFVKALIVLPDVQLLASSGSDRVVRLWDISFLASTSSRPTKALASLKAHTRPVERFATYTYDGRTVLYSADSMGRICVWTIEREGDAARGQLRCEWREHETGVYDIWLDAERGHCWTGASRTAVCAYAAIYPVHSLGRQGCAALHL